MKLDEIQMRYSITTNDLGEIKTELRRKLKESHPDNNSDFNSEYFNQLKEDFDYVEKLLKVSEFNETLVPVNEIIKTLAEVLQVPAKEENNQKEKLEIELSANVQNQISQIKKRRRVSKYSSASLLAIITFLWMFPDQVISHPLMGLFFGHIEAAEYALFITGIWFCILMLTIGFWLKVAQEERIEKEIVDRVKLESVQNRIFMKFLDSILPEKQFTKLDFMKYLSNGINIVDKMKMKLSFVSRFHLQEEVIQNMADIILLRAKEYEIIKAVKPHGLIECYEIISQDE